MGILDLSCTESCGSGNHSPGTLGWGAFREWSRSCSSDCWLWVLFSKSTPPSCLCHICTTTLIKIFPHYKLMAQYLLPASPFLGVRSVWDKIPLCLAAALLPGSCSRPDVCSRVTSSIWPKEIIQPLFKSKNEDSESFLLKLFFVFQPKA